MYLLCASSLVFGETSLSRSIAELRRKVDTDLSVGVDIVDLSTGERTYSASPETPLIPASVLKLATSYAALKELGGEWSWLTEVRADRSLAQCAADGKNSGYAGNIYIQGNGDPGLTTDRILQLADEIYLSGIRTVDEIVVDDSQFVSPPGRSGPNPYQAALSALPINFNSLEVHITPAQYGSMANAAVTRGAPYRVRSNVRTTKGDRSSIQLSDDEHDANVLQVSGEIGVGATKRVEYISIENPSEVFGAVFADALRRSGVAVKGGARVGRTPEHSEPILVVPSRPLHLAIGDMNRFSSNFLAGQMVFALGRGVDGRYRFDAGVERIRKLMKALHPSDLTIVDGSGLERANRIAPALLTAILYKTYGNSALAPDFFGSLSRFNLRGTLKHRNLGVADQDGVWAKTGTLDGVSSLAGILQSQSGKHFAFAIITNGLLEKTRAIQFEDEIVRALLEDRLER